MANKWGSKTMATEIKTQPIRTQRYLTKLGVGDADYRDSCNLQQALAPSVIGIDHSE